MIRARFELFGTEDTPGVPDKEAGLGGDPVIRGQLKGKLICLATHRG